MNSIEFKNDWKNEIIQWLKITAVWFIFLWHNLKQLITDKVQYSYIIIQ